MVPRQMLARLLGVFHIGFRNSATGRTMKQDVLVMENLFYQHQVLSACLPTTQQPSPAPRFPLRVCQSACPPGLLPASRPLKNGFDRTFMLRLPRLSAITIMSTFFMLESLLIQPLPCSLLLGDITLLGESVSSFSPLTPTIPSRRTHTHIQQMWVRRCHISLTSRGRCAAATLRSPGTRQTCCWTRTCWSLSAKILCVCAAAVPPLKDERGGEGGHMPLAVARRFLWPSTP